MKLMAGKVQYLFGTIQEANAVEEAIKKLPAAVELSDIVEGRPAYLVAVHDFGLGHAALQPVQCSIRSVSFGKAVSWFDGTKPGRVDVGYDGQVFSFLNTDFFSDYQIPGLIKAGYDSALD